MTHSSIKPKYSRPELKVFTTIEESVICASLDNITEEEFDFDWEI